MYVHTKLLQSCPTLFDTVDLGLPGSSVHGSLQARILEWVAMPSSRGSSPPRDRTHISYIPCTDRRVLYHLHHLGSPCAWYSAVFILVGSMFQKSVCPNHSVQFSRSVMSDSLRPHELQHARPPGPSPTPGVHSDSCPSSP